MQTPRPSSSVSTDCDVLVVGGGINGTAIARDLAGRGLRVVLCERDDLAQHTSSSSTKLIHGGLRYLEHREFLLVRKALVEREVLLKSAPHIMWPLRFVMPHDAGMRPAWMIRLGLFLYDHLARREVLRDSRSVNLRKHPAGLPLKAGYALGFVYSDGWVDDARFVLLNALDAAEHGAEVLTRCACTRAERGAEAWSVTLVGAEGRARPVRARAVVNATGPWAAQFLHQHCIDPAHPTPRPRPLRLIKGSHIVVKQRFTHDHAYIFQNPDQRIIFAIPYEKDFTLIGTTDVEHVGPLDALRVDDAEVNYLCEQASRYFERPVQPADVVWRYCGVRPLLDDDSAHAGKSASQVTRDYALELNDNGAPLMSVWGGKITTCRKLAEEAANLLAPRLGAVRGAWTHAACLPGGDFRSWIGAPHRPDIDFARFEQALWQKHSALGRPLLQRWARAYGTRVEQIVAGGLGQRIAGDLYEAELRYLFDHEWARRSEDVLWRRSKLGLHLSAQDIQAVEVWCAKMAAGR